MAGDWIKMRVNLVTHPKVLAISERLASDGEYQDWSTMAGFVPSCGGTQDEYERDYLASLRVTRYVTVCALLRFWGYANEHAKDEFIASLRVSDIDDVVQVPSFGDALEHVGWVVYDAVRRGINLPNFNEFNVSGVERSAGAKTAAQRQREYRERQKSDVTRDVTNDVTRNRREEKSREEKKKEEIQETAPRKRSTPPVFELPDWINREHWDAWHSCAKRRKASAEQKALAVAKLETWRKAGQDFAGALENAAVGGYQGLFLPDAQKAGNTSFAQQAADVARTTVPSRQGRDPVLLEIERHSANAAPIPENIRERLQALKGGVLQ